MSLVAITWAFKQECKPMEKWVLVSLADNADDDGIAWPGLSFMETKTGLSHRGIQQILGRLVEVGRVGVLARTRENGSQSSNMYFLAVHGVENMKAEMDAWRAPHHAEDAPHQTPIGMRRVQGGGEEYAPPEPPSNQRKRYSPSEVLLLFDSQEMEFLNSTYSEVDLAVEAATWSDWNTKGVVKPKASFRNWLKKAEAIRLANLANGKVGRNGRRLGPMEREIAQDELRKYGPMGKRGGGELASKNEELRRYGPMARP
jgi:hypothetical protein